MKTKKLTEQENLNLANELRSLTSKWVETFNFIQLDVLNIVAEKENTSLMECIRQEKLTFDNIAEYSNLTAKQLKRKYKTVEECPEYETAREEIEQRNYPMWNTCFEFKQKEYDNVINAAIEAGFGIIEGLGDFNQILFVRGCGYSFYGAHWIPLFLNLPWNSELKKKYAGVNYDMI